MIKLDSEFFHLNSKSGVLLCIIYVYDIRSCRMVIGSLSRDTCSANSTRERAFDTFRINIPLHSIRVQCLITRHAQFPAFMSARFGAPAPEFIIISVFPVNFLMGRIPITYHHYYYDYYLSNRNMSCIGVCRMCVFYLKC